MTLLHTGAAGITTALLDRWTGLGADERLAAFKALPPGADDDLFLSLSTADQAELVRALPAEERRLWLRALPPDDVADVLQALRGAEREGWLALLDRRARDEVSALLAYAEDEAGGLMNPRFARLRPSMTADEALRYLRLQAQARVETVYYAYVVDADGRLVGVVSFRELFAARGSTPLAGIMRTDAVTVAPDDDQEAVARVIADHDLLAVPVVDADRRLVGIVTVDDVVDVVQEAATADLQKAGGMEALDQPYLKAGLPEMLRKRAGWLALLFVGELLTASVMAGFEERLAHAVVLATFIPLVISSGGNAGSQAAMLVTRALALGEVRPADALRVGVREAGTGVVLGVLLAAVGLLRVVLWEGIFGTYGARMIPVALTLSASVLCVVAWGTIAGAMLPLLIRRLGFDPASASAPFVATLVDVSGLAIYFTLAGWLVGV